MLTSMLKIAVALAASAAISPAFAGMVDSAGSDRLTLKIARAGDRNAAPPEIKVVGSGGKYDRIATLKFVAALELSAQPADTDAYKVVRSRLTLKTDGTATASNGVDALPDGMPSAAFAANTEFDLPIDGNGPIAQNAIALCNGIPTGERGHGASVRRTMSIAVAWYVTTGRFAFKWTNYDRVAPSNDILRNPDFYADQITQDAETLIAADVVCAPLSSDAIATKPAVQNPVRQVALIPEPIAQAGARDPKVAQQISQADIQADIGKPRCDGGMVRQMSTAAESFLCLCPGNTTRTELGANAFACERRTRR